MTQIVITQDLGLDPKDIEKLKKLGELTIYEKVSKTPDEWLKRCKNADIICTGKFGLKTEKTYKLKNVFLVLPFVGTGFLDKQKLKENNITVSYCPGCNTDAVSEWIIGMIINLLRDLPETLKNKPLTKRAFPKETLSLTNKNITILGKGNIGNRVGKICKAFGMKVNYFSRNSKLIESVKTADIIVNTLSKNPSSENLLGTKFFDSLKKGSFFLSVTSPSIFDTDAMIKALNECRLEKVAIDAGGIQVGNINDPYYQKMLAHPKILLTPHIAFNTDVTNEVSSKMIVKNIEAWLNKKPINLIE
ncbi:hydroxyacid dehydrogenase [archaeon]|jgi:glycerate dehydrogenase|nr:hydroxyacid dehydrogenase [archaeon]MBT4397496.1 hydroxyacid dehydrogenase [archaeon]MBT4440891.1 hydroxyacid dehydrogenase [archaeon]